MRGPFALRAEISDGLDNAGSEVHLPEAIHGDARQQRVVRDRSSHLAKPSRLFGAPGGQRRQDRRHAGLDFLARLVIGAADEQVRSRGGRALRHHHHGGKGPLAVFRLVLLQRDQRLPGVADLPAPAFSRKYQRRTAALPGAARARPVCARWQCCSPAARAAISSCAQTRGRRRGRHRSGRGSGCSGAPSGADAQRFVKPRPALRNGRYRVSSSTCIGAGWPSM